MTREEALKIFDELSETENPIPCIVSTSKISGNGMIVEIINKNPFPDIIVEIDGVEHNIPCIGVMRR